MSAGGRRAAAVLALVAGALMVAGCGNENPVAATRTALEQSGYGDVEVTVRAGGGFDVARVDALSERPVEEATGDDDDGAAQVVWRTLPVRFDQLVVTLGPAPAAYSYEDLARRFGPRDPALDRRHVSQQVVEDGLELMLLLTAGAALSVGGVVVAAALVLRAARRRRGPPGGAGDQFEGPTSGLGSG